MPYDAMASEEDFEGEMLLDGEADGFEGLMGLSDDEDDFDAFEDFGGDEFSGEEGLYEDDAFFKSLARRVKRGIKKARRIAKVVAPLAKRLAPLAGKVIGGAAGSLIPGAGTALGATLGSGLGTLVANMEDEDGFDVEDTDEADEFGADEEQYADGSVEDDAIDMMADEASKAPSKTDAQGLAAAGAMAAVKNAPAKVKAVAPTLATSSARLAGAMASTPQAKPLAKAMPTIQRKTVATLSAKASKGKPVTPKTAKRVMAKHAKATLGSTSALTKAIAKNEAKIAKRVMTAER